MPVLHLLTNCLPILKKTAASKRAALPRSADYAKTLLEDWQRLSHAGRYDMHQLKEAMLLLIYQLEANLINFVRAGTHSELFSA